MSLTIDCPKCSVPGQHVGMGCAWCGELVPVPAEAVDAGGIATVEEVIGWRGWKTTRLEDGEVRITSPLFTEIIWEPGEWLVATCSSHNMYDPADPKYHGPDTPDRARWSPVKGCGGTGHGCGFYAGRTRNHLIELGYARYNEQDPRVLGEVQMAGKIIPATNGWRAQKVKLRSIFVPYEAWELCNELDAVYGPHGVKVELAATLVMPKGDLLWCKKCSASMGRSPTCPLCGYTHV